MVSKPVMIAEGIAFPEGPVWCEDGTLVVTSVAEGALYRIWPETGNKKKIADTAGGANSCWPVDDGGFIVTQNGGIDFASVFAAHGLSLPFPFPPLRRVEAGLQRVAADGSVFYLLRGMQAPNDLVVAPDGTIFFTDPPAMPSPQNAAIGCVRALRPGGTVELIADGFTYCNGIALEKSGRLVVVEGSGLMRLHAGGEKEWIVETLGNGAADGFCLDAEGRFYLASSMENGVRIIEDNKEVEFMDLPESGLSTNCCFGGSDGRSLFVTNGLPGTVWMWAEMPTPGMALNTYSSNVFHER